MQANSDLYACRVCGLLQAEPPWGEDGKTPTFEICDCCGTEFGYEDCFVETVRLARAKWQTQNAQWFEPKAKPENWSMEEQLKQIPADFR